LSWVVDACRRSAFGGWVFIVVASKRKVATMPGKRITDLHVSKHKELRGKFSQEAVAAKTEIIVASARRLESSVSAP